MLINRNRIRKDTNKITKQTTLKKSINQVKEIFKMIYIFEVIAIAWIDRLCYNPLLTWDLVTHYIEVSWNYVSLSSNQCVT